MKVKRAATYESEALGALAYEFPFSNKAEAETKIKRRLKRKKLGNYDPERINLLRALKDELQQEISKGEKSAWFTHRHDHRYVDMRDFNIDQLAKRMIKRYPHVPKKEINHFVPFCVFLYYLL
jgi:hypothetical protein